MNIETERPSQVTAAQHIFPRACLAKFAGPEGRLHVRNMRTGQIESHGPGSRLFTTKRCWDQRTEARLMHGVETEFGRVASPISKGRAHSIRDEQQLAVTKMYGLWSLRAHRAREPIEDVTLNRIIVAGPVPSDADVDRLEAHGIITVGSGGRILGRHLAGPQLFMDLESICEELKHVRWNVLKAADGAGEFCIPDSPANIPYIPISPRIVLAPAAGDGLVGRDVVADLNTDAFRSSMDYVAGRDLTACPCREP